MVKYNGILDYLDLDFYNSGIQSGISKVQVLKPFNLAGCNFYIGENSNYTFSVGIKVNVKEIFLQTYEGGKQQITYTIG